MISDVDLDRTVVFQFMVIRQECQMGSKEAKKQISGSTSMSCTMQSYIGQATDYEIWKEISTHGSASILNERQKRFGNERSVTKAIAKRVNYFRTGPKRSHCSHIFPKTRNDSAGRIENRGSIGRYGTALLHYT